MGWVAIVIALGLGSPWLWNVTIRDIRRVRYMRGVVRVDGEEWSTSWYNLRTMSVAHNPGPELVASSQSLNCRSPPGEWEHFSALGDYALRRLDGPRWEQRICEASRDRLRDAAVKDATTARTAMGKRAVETFEAACAWHPVPEEHAALVELANQRMVHQG